MGEDHVETPEAILIAVLPPGAEEAAITTVLARLRKSAELVGCQFDASSDGPPGSRWVIEASSTRGQGETPARIWLVPTPTHLLDEHVVSTRVSREELEDGQRSEWSLSVGTLFESTPLLSYHWMTRLLAAAVGEALLVIDVNACCVHRGPWLPETARATVPPHPTTLFTVHCVGDGPGPRWMHTHGLDRCGSIELEMLDVPRDHTGSLCELLNAAAMMFIEHAMPDEGEPFYVGQNMPLVWLPWRKALKRLPPRGPGSMDDRFPPHDGATGVLAIPRKGWLFGARYESPAQYVNQLERGAILYFSDMETERAARLAKERFARFRELFLAHRAQHREAEFSIKLGYETEQGGREHLWFRVHELSDEAAVATCVNRPYAVAAVREGERAVHALDRLSGWMIACPEGSYGPDSVHRLEALWSGSSPSPGRSAAPLAPADESH